MSHRAVRRVAWAAIWMAPILAASPGAPARADGPEASKADPKVLFGRDNLVAWCIVPFDSKRRGPEDRAEMLRRLGFRRFAYDWRPEHAPTFDAELDALARRGIALDGFWAPGVLDDDARRILDVLGRHRVKTTLWVLLGFPAGEATGAEQDRRVARAVDQLRPLAEAAGAIGCDVALYNHGGWFGEPENQVAIVERLKAAGSANVGVVYNLHHGHAHLGRLPAVLSMLMPHLRAINLNGSDPGGDATGRKILPIGQGSMDLAVLRAIVESGYRGPIGVLGHTDDDAEARLRDNLDGLDWLVPQLGGAAPGPRPTPRTPVPAPPPTKSADDLRVGEELLAARESGDGRRGAGVFASAKFACASCHRVGDRGGAVGPDLSAVGACLKPEQVVESVLWPSKSVKDEYVAIALATADGRVRRGYRQAESADSITLRDPASGDAFTVKKAEVEEAREVGTLMPAGLADAMTPAERRDLLRFLLDLGRPGGTSAADLAHASHEPAPFAYDRAPIDPSRSPSWRHPVNRDRVYDFYAKEAEHFAGVSPPPPLLPAFPGLDGGAQGHWGNQNEATWENDRWGRSDLGRVLAGVFRGAGVTVPKGVCVSLGAKGEMAACFNPETLNYEAVWAGGFVKFSTIRHGFMHGLMMDGKALPRPEARKVEKPSEYHGFYRSGDRVVFAYRIGDEEWLDSPTVEGGRFVRTVARRDDPALAALTRGGPPRWPQVLETKGTLGAAGPYAIDTVAIPEENPWRALFSIGDHDFLPDGSAMVCTMQGDVWRVDGLDRTLERVRWRRFASGIHQALGLVTHGGDVYVLGRDQITRLVDLDGDGEADFHECVSNAYPTSPGGHDFLCGLQRDAQGRFYAASSYAGILRIDPATRSYEVVATGFRNPDGIGLGPDGTITAPSSEGEWTPASMIAEIKAGGHYGYPGPKGGAAPDLPLVYLPRGLDNSSGGQVTAPDDPRFGPLAGRLLHFSFGMGTFFEVLRDEVDGQPQGAVVPLPGEFASGVHRGRFNPVDGQLYASGMAGWGSYTVAPGSFQRVRYTGEPARLPTSIHAAENGVVVGFSTPVDRAVAEAPGAQFAQDWNYRYSAGYGSAELSPAHPGTTGHDLVAIRSTRVLADGKSLFLEIPEIRPVDALHLHLRVDSGPPVDLFATVHRLGPPFSGVPGYRPPAPRSIPAHPRLADMAAIRNPPPPNPWGRPIPGERWVRIEAGKNLGYTQRRLTARAGEPIRLIFDNPDTVPHNWALARPGTLSKVGDLANKLVADPEAARRQYVPRTDDVIAYTDVVPPGQQATISFRAPATPGVYPYLCTFPGHWMVMNGELVVE